MSERNQSQSRVEKEINELLQYCIGFGSELLEKYGEFFPIGAYVGVTGEIVPLAVYDGEDRPDSEIAIGQLQHEFHQRILSGHAMGWAVAFDARVTSAEYPEGTDAVVVNTVHALADQQLQYTFPYHLEDGVAEFAENWWITPS